MKNVILYVRVSTDEQADRGFSLRDQEEKLVQYCRDNNYHILKIYKEDYLQRLLIDQSLQSYWLIVKPMLLKLMNSYF